AVHRSVNHQLFQRSAGFFFSTIAQTCESSWLHEIPGGGIPPWLKTGPSRSVPRKVMVNTLPSKRKIHYASLILADSCQWPLYWRRLGRPPSRHHRCGSIASPLTVEPFRRRLHQTTRLSAQYHYENFVHRGSDFQGRTFENHSDTGPAAERHVGKSVGERSRKTP